jgi:HEAT repeat protein
MNDRAAGQRAIFGGGIRLLLAVCAFAFPAAFWVLANPATARAAWAEIARMVPFRVSQGGGAGTRQLSDAALAALPAQEQAESLLQAAIEQSTAAAEQITARAAGWRGHLKPTARLAGLLNTALNAPGLKARRAAVEVELALNNLAENSATADKLIARVDGDRAARPWGLWMLGALGNHGIESARILSVLSAYSRDSNERTRFWAVEGLSLLGKEQSIPLLLTALRSDRSDSVRERAASALAHSGMLTKAQRYSAVPALINDTSDPSLDRSAQMLAYHALHDITGARVDNTPFAWRDYWANHSTP